MSISDFRFTRVVCRRGKRLYLRRDCYPTFGIWSKTFVDKKGAARILEVLQDRLDRGAHVPKSLSVPVDGRVNLNSPKTRLHRIFIPASANAWKKYPHRLSLKDVDGLTEMISHESIHSVLHRMFGAEVSTALEKIWVVHGISRRGKLRDYHQLSV